MGLVSTPVVRRAGSPMAARAVVAGGRAARRLRPAGDTCSGARSRSRAGPPGSGTFRRGIRGDTEVTKDVLEAVVAQHRALEPSRADVDAEEVEQVVGTERGDVFERLALYLVGEKARAGLAGRAATAGGTPPIHDHALPPQ